MAKIDVLLAVFNGEKYMREQVESILNQSYPSIHLWIRDNCSQDGTREIILDLQKQHPDTITFLRAPENQGIIGNFSALMEASRANYIMLSDADDVWLPGKIVKTMGKMEALEEKYGCAAPLLVHSDLSVVDAHLNLIDPSFWNYSHLDPGLPHTLCRQLIQNQITGCTLMMNRALLELALPIPLEAMMHDWWLGICIAAFGKMDFVNEPTMLYRQHGKNDTGAKRYGLFSFLRRVQNLDRKKLNETKVKTFQQARIFLERYRHRLNAAQVRSIEGFLEYPRANLLKRIYLVLKWGIYRTGFLRNLILILTSMKPKGVA